MPAPASLPTPQPSNDIPASKRTSLTSLDPFALPPAALNPYPSGSSNRGSISSARGSISSSTSGGTASAAIATGAASSSAYRPISPASPNIINEFRERDQSNATLQQGISRTSTSSTSTTTNGRKRSSTSTSGRAAKVGGKERQSISSDVKEEDEREEGERMDEAYRLPPPPTRSRKIIQMRPRAGTGGSVGTASGTTAKSSTGTASASQGGSATATMAGNLSGGSGNGNSSASSAPTVTPVAPAGPSGSTGSGKSRKNTNNASTAAGRKIARKTAHSLIERRRRSKMNEEFGVLKDMIPACSGQEMHKLAILQAAIEYMRYLEKCVNDLKAANERSRRSSTSQFIQAPPPALRHPSSATGSANPSASNTPIIFPQQHNYAYPMSAGSGMHSHGTHSTHARHASQQMDPSPTSSNPDSDPDSAMSDASALTPTNFPVQPQPPTQSLSQNRSRNPSITTSPAFLPTISPNFQPITSPHTLQSTSPHHRSPHIRPSASPALGPSPGRDPALSNLSISHGTNPNFSLSALPSPTLQMPPNHRSSIVSLPATFSLSASGQPPSHGPFHQSGALSLNNSPAIPPSGQQGQEGAPSHSGGALFGSFSLGRPAIAGGARADERDGGNSGSSTREDVEATAALLMLNVDRRSWGEKTAALRKAEGEDDDDGEDEGLELAAPEKKRRGKGVAMSVRDLLSPN